MDGNGNENQIADYEKTSQCSLDIDSLVTGIEKKVYPIDKSAENYAIHLNEKDTKLPDIDQEKDESIESTTVSTKDIPHTNITVRVEFSEKSKIDQSHTSM